MSRYPGLLLTMVIIGASILSQCGRQPAKDWNPVFLPEHPRPDFQHLEGLWLNLNGQWDFSLDSLDVGEKEGWQKGDVSFPNKINVPFSWASPYSGIGRKDVHIGWYSRELPEEWQPGGGTFLVISACDCVTSAWLNGKPLGSHEGGYTPFEFNLTDALTREGPNRLVLRVEDKPTPGRLVGKQVYGEAKGIWQTVYLERRSEPHITKIHFQPDIDRKLVTVNVAISKPAGEGCSVSVWFDDSSRLEEQGNCPIPSGKNEATFDIPVDAMHLWSLEDPHLYMTTVLLKEKGDNVDCIDTYFGMRKIGMARLPGSDAMYITLNDRPVYLKMTLDQSYHPDGYYTFPTDSFMRGEIERAKALGLNAIRTHIKSEIPRKLYWADRLGLLIMADIPNIGGEPDDYGRANWEYTAFHQIDRDFNHPSIFSWVLFNETWGLVTRTEKLPGEYVREYSTATQEWVKSLYHRVREIDPTRLVEDNSPAQGGGRHVISDINSWHAYIAGHKWSAFMDRVVKSTYPGSSWNYMDGYVQPDIPMMNSECGGVWGYRGGTGDIDLSYDYHLMMNEYRKRPKICGFLFTEFHDVINEWNGYYRFDRSRKEFGLDELCSGMTVRDFHSDCYLVIGDDFTRTVKPGERFAIPVTASLLTDTAQGTMTVHTLLHGWNRLGEHTEYAKDSFTFEARPYATFALPPVTVTAPEEDCLAVFCTTLIDKNGAAIHRNFIPVQVRYGDAPRKENMRDGSIIVRCSPGSFTAGEWKVKQRSVFGGLKVWGTGTGYFEYSFPWPDKIEAGGAVSGEFIAELGSRRIQGKDMNETFVRQSINDVTARGIDPGHNPNSYPMTDLKGYPSTVAISFNGIEGAPVTLEKDPADHRGLLSWINQKRDRPSDHPDYLSWLYRNDKSVLDEAGSYGYLVKVPLPPEALVKAEEEGLIRVRLEVSKATDHSGGLAVYGEKFGRYPVDPIVVLKEKQ